MISKEAFKGRIGNSNVQGEVEVTPVLHVEGTNPETGADEEIDVVELKGWFRIDRALPMAIFGFIATIGPLIH